MKDNEDFYTLRRLINRATVKELKGAGIVFPFRKGRVNMEIDSDENILPSKKEGK